MGHKTSLREVLKKLEPPAELERVLKCKLCGQPLHWFPINRQVGFWIHHGNDIAICADKNPLHPGKPLIAQWMGFYPKTYEVWDELVTEIVARQNSRKRKNMSKLQMVHIQPPQTRQT